MDIAPKFGTIPAGRQILELYQSPGLVLRPCSIMADSLRLVRQGERNQKPNGQNL